MNLKQLEGGSAVEKTVAGLVGSVDRLTEAVQRRDRGPISRRAISDLEHALAALDAHGLATGDPEVGRIADGLRKARRVPLTSCAPRAAEESRADTDAHGRPAAGG